MYRKVELCVGYRWSTSPQFSGTTSDSLEYRRSYAVKRTLKPKNKNVRVDPHRERYIYGVQPSGIIVSQRHTCVEWAISYVLFVRAVEDYASQTVEETGRPFEANDKYTCVRPP